MMYIVQVSRNIWQFMFPVKKYLIFLEKKGFLSHAGHLGQLSRKRDNVLGPRHQELTLFFIFSLVLEALTYCRLVPLITTAVVPERHTHFEMIFWSNCAWLNMCRAVLNLEHFEGPWVWLSFNIHFYKDGKSQAPTSVHQWMYHICTHRGRGD